MRRQLIIWMLIITSCVDPVTLDLPTSNPKLVVFGWITNEVRPYEVKLSLTNDFNDQTSYPVVSGAEVYVLDRLEQRFDFLEDGSTGRYYSDPNEFVGVIGNAYTLNVITNEGTHYISSSEPLWDVPPLDSTSINFLADPDVFDITDDEDNYFVTGFIADDEELSNYYRWKVFVNGELRNQPTELTLFDDNFANGNIFRFDASNVLFKKDQVIRIEHSSLTANAYEYYSLLKRQTENNQLEPRPIPAMIVGNITNSGNTNELVLGYFGASEVRSYALEWR